MSELKTLVLASSSRHRKTLLAKLGLPFQSCSPNIDESAQPNESPKSLVLRLALSKAKEVAHKFPDALIIGSDQVAILDQEIIGKPHSHDIAAKQLQKFSGQTITFLTSLCLYNNRTKKHQLTITNYSVTFRTLKEPEINQYLKIEQPYDCAGSFKSEGLGIVLFEKMTGDDPNALIGLPLISLTTMLKQEGVSPI